jgi:hypothetical protein
VKSSDSWWRREIIGRKLLDILAADDLPRLNSDWIVIAKRFCWHNESLEGALYWLVLGAHEFPDLWYFF